METITEKLGRYYSLIGNYQEGATDTRYKSWEWCHKAFLENRHKTDEDNIEYLSLHLAFYLASWGMYRGSSFLLQRDYKTHKEAVREILKPKYESLWDYVPESDNIEATNDLLFDEGGVYWIIKNCYRGFDDNTSEDEASDTLTTKILMGTFGCVPAFDRFLKAGIKCYHNNNRDENTTRIGDYKLSQSIEKSNGAATESFKALAQFAVINSRELALDTVFYYPPMKCVDMYFWEIGYEMDIVSLLEKEKTGDNTRRKLLERAKELRYCNPDATVEEAITQIKQLNCNM